MELFSILFIIIGLILGYIIAHFKQKGSQLLSKEEATVLEQNYQKAKQGISQLEERNRNLSNQLKESQQAQKEASRQAHEAEKQWAALHANHQNMKERLAEQKEEMQDLQKRFKEEFENLANKILEEKSKKFTEQNREKLDQLLKPLGEKMDAFRQKVEQTHKEDLKGRSALDQHLKHLHELNQQMADEAKNLTKALKGDSKTQGSWGEVILQRILEKSGLTKGREYEIQETHTTAGGSHLRPDVVVYLPDDKRIIIDSKVSLTAYERFVSSDDLQTQQQFLKQHIASLRSHVKNLGSKNYQNLYEGNSPDFVLLFVPIESAFGLALQDDTTLYYEAFDKNIVIVSPSTLLATLATIDSVWKQEYQSKNAREIAKRGGALFDKFVGFIESMEEIDQRIRQTRDSYNQAMNRLSEGRGNVIRQAEMLRKLGAKNSKNMPSETQKRYVLKQQEEKGEN